MKKIAILTIMTCLLAACNTFSGDSLSEAVVNPVPKKTLSNDTDKTQEPASEEKQSASTPSEANSQIIPAPTQQNSGQAVVPNVAPALGE